LVHSITRKVVAAVGAVGIAAALVACGGSGSEPESTGEAGVFDPKAWEGSTVRVLRHSGYDADVMRSLFDEFTEWTGITVEMDEVPFGNLRTKEVTELSSGLSTYDLMATPDYWLAEYASADWLRPLDDLMTGTATADPDFDLEDITPRLIEANQVDGSTYALPWKFNTGVIAYRTDVFDEAPQTYEDWLAAADAAEAAGMSLIGGSLGAANAPEYFLDFVVANGGEFLNKDNTEAAFNSPEGKEALEFLVEIMGYSADGQVNRAWDESAQLMANGVTASDIVLSSVASTAASGAAEGKVAFTPLVPAATTSSFMNTWGLLIPKASQNPEGAFLLMQFLLNKENVKGMAEGGGGSVVPARQSLLDELSATFPSFEAQKTAAENGTFWPKITTLDAARTAVAPFVQQAVLGQLSVSDALAQAEDAVNAAINP